MLDVFAKIRRVAPYFRTLLVTGSTGTGKELAALALHRLSPARGGQFVVCNCVTTNFGSVQTDVQSAMQPKEQQGNGESPPIIC
jgi:DNA-binding NtrC family response regulator